MIGIGIDTALAVGGADADVLTAIAVAVTDIGAGFSLRPRGVEDAGVPVASS